MIIEALINLFVAPFLNLLNSLPTFGSDLLESWSTVRDTLINIFHGVGILFPFDALMPLIYATISLHVFRLALAIILRIKSFIPSLGGT